MNKESSVTPMTIYDYVFKNKSADYFEQYGKMNCFPDDWQAKAKEILSSFPREQYLAMAMRYDFGDSHESKMTYADIAQNLNISVGKAAKLVKTGNEELHQRLLNCGNRCYDRLIVAILNIEDGILLDERYRSMIPEWENDLGVNIEELKRCINELSATERYVIERHFGISNNAERLSLNHIEHELCLDEFQVKFALTSALSELRKCISEHVVINMNEVVLRGFSEGEKITLVANLRENYPFRDWIVKMFKQLEGRPFNEIVEKYCDGDEELADKVCDKLFVMGCMDPRTGEIPPTARVDGYPIECIATARGAEILKRFDLDTIEKYREYYVNSKRYFDNSQVNIV